MDNIVNFTINLNGTAYTGVAQLDEALGNVLVDVQKTQSWFGSLKDAIGASSIKLDAFIGVVEKVSQAFQSLVGSSLDFEQQQANMRTLLNGDTEATDNLIGKIREYGKATVYDRSGLIEAQKTMMAFGLDAEYAFGKLKNIGDIALGDKQKMQSLALAFSQMSSTGKLMGQDLLQMINAGFNPLEVISQKTGKSIAELKEEMGKGAISAEMVAQAFEWATEEGGRFYQGAETAAQTTAGKIAKVKDQIDDFKISLFEWSHGLTAWIAEMGNMVVPISQAIPMFKVFYNISASAFKHLKALDFAGMLGGIGRKATEARISLAFMRKDIETCSMASLGFIRNTVRATMAVGRFATVGLFNAVKGMGAYLLSLVTGGAASRTFANVATASFAKFALSAKAACSAVSVAITGLDFAGILGVISRKATEARISLAFMRKDIETCSMASLGFIRNTVRATMAVGRFATVGLFNAVKGMGAYLLSLVTGGAASRTFANVATVSFAKFALSAKAACKAVSVAVTSIPIIGWIAAAVTAAIGIVALLWNKCEGFRRLVFGTWEVVKAAVNNAWQYVKTAAQVTWEVLKRVFTRLKEALSGLWERIKDLFTRLKAALAEAWNRIKPVLANIAEKVWGAVKVVMKVVAVVSLVVGAVIAAVGLLVKTVWDNLLKPLFQRLFSIVSTVVSRVATAVGNIVSFVTSIPDRISIALEKVRTFFADLWSSVTSTVRDDVDRITGFVTSIPERISTALDNVRAFFARVWDGITGKVRSCIDRIKELVENLRSFVTETFAKAGDFIAGVWERVTEAVGSAVDWIADKLGRIAGWVKTKMVDPIRNAFTGMWNVIRDVFDKILTKLGKLFAPIRELWNKLFPKDKMKDVKLAYAEGADKGTKSWEKSKNKGDVDTGKETIVLDGKDGLDGLAGVNGKSGKDGKTKKELSDGALGKNAGTVAGKAQQITIKLENMVGTMNFNGGLRDNASNVESTLAEMMARILGMAETAA